MDGAPSVRYADLDGAEIAYQVFGDGEVTLLITPGLAQNLEVLWEDPRAARFFRRHALFCRVVLFDKRGTGLSSGEVPTSFAERIDDMRAVLDAEGIEKAFIGGVSDGGSMSALFAATYPERTLGLLLVMTAACFTRRDDLPWQPTTEEWDAFGEAWANVYGTGRAVVDALCPSLAGDEEAARWWGRYERLSATPKRFRQLWALAGEIDVRAVLPTIRVPTLVLDRDHAFPSVENPRYLAARIPGAKLVVFPGVDHVAWVGDQDGLIDEIERFITGTTEAGPHERVLTTVLFTDIVDSTATASRVGDAAWRQSLDVHDAVAAATISRHGGRLVKHTGDGVLATFDLPSRAVLAAGAMQHDLDRDHIALRAGVHTGEVERRGDDVSGLAVHIASRVAGLADAGEIVVSSTVKELCAGAGLSFASRGSHTMKGVIEPWMLYEVLDLH